MAISIDWTSRVITIPQADLTLVGGTLYELDTDAFRLALKTIEDSEEGMAFPATHRHNTAITVAGTTFARTLEIINGYSVQFEDGAYTVRLVNSNNNLFDVESGILVQNSVQVIAQNSAGLIIGEGASPADIWQGHNLENGYTPEQCIRLILSAVQGKLAIDAGTGIVTTRDLADTKDRLAVLTNEDGERLTVVRDVS